MTGNRTKKRGIQEMVKQLELQLLPGEAADPAFIRRRVAEELQLNGEDIEDILPLRRSIDARGSQPLVRLRLEVFVGEAPSVEPAILSAYRPVHDCPPALIVGAGPAGYFAALELIGQGIRPVILDRGKDVRARRRDLRAIQQFGEVNPHSNYCFGEGGAGAYSDGKLYTRSHKRGSVEKTLRLLVEHGAESDILVEAHPHIGSNKLPKIVAAIRESIRHYGGEIHFDSLVTDIIVEKGKAAGVLVGADTVYRAEAVLLASRHSPRLSQSGCASSTRNPSSTGYSTGSRHETSTCRRRVTNW